MAGVEGKEQATALERPGSFNQFVNAYSQ